MIYRTSSAARVSALDGIRVLLLEDDPLTAWHLAANLGKCGAVVYSPRSSARTVDGLFRQSGLLDKVDVAILDADLGNHTSEAFARHLYANQIPFLFYTGDESAVGAFLRENRVPVIAKPAHVDVIVRAILGVTCGASMTADV